MNLFEVVGKVSLGLARAKEASRRTALVAGVVFAIGAGTSTAQDMRSAELIVRADQPKSQIHPHVYGHFAEHLGRLIMRAFGSVKTRRFQTLEVCAMTCSQR